MSQELTASTGPRAPPQWGFCARKSVGGMVGGSVGAEGHPFPYHALGHTQLTLSSTSG